MREANVNINDTEFGAMGITELLDLGRAADLRDLEALSCRGDGAIVKVETNDRMQEDRLDDLGCVDRWEHLSESQGVHVYVIEFSAPTLPESIGEKAADLLGTCDPDVDERGASISLTGSQDAIAGVIKEYEEAGVALTLQRLGDYEGDSKPLDELTDRQREVIQTAYDLGYFEVPREASTEDVAEELGIDSSTATEHLQRAERNLLTHHL
jgi:hypothetical protein